MFRQTPTQIAWVTDDLAATEATLSVLLGARKWIRLPNVHFGPDTCFDRGAPADHYADIALSYAGDTQLELISPIRGDSIYTAFLAEHGSGLHHVCRETDDVDAAIEQAKPAAAVVARGTMPGGMKFAYLTAPSAGVPYLEIAFVPPEIKAFFDYVKQEQAAS